MLELLGCVLRNELQAVGFLLLLGEWGRGTGGKLWGLGWRKGLNSGRKVVLREDNLGTTSC